MSFPKYTLLLSFGINFVPALAQWGACGEPPTITNAEYRKGEKNATYYFCDFGMSKKEKVNTELYCNGSIWSGIRIECEMSNEAKLIIGLSSICALLLILLIIALFKLYMLSKNSTPQESSERNTKKRISWRPQRKPKPSHLKRQAPSTRGRVSSDADEYVDMDSPYLTPITKEEGKTDMPSFTVPVSGIPANNSTGMTLTEIQLREMSQPHFTGFN